MLGYHLIFIEVYIGLSLQTSTLFFLKMATQNSIVNIFKDFFLFQEDNLEYVYIKINFVAPF